MKGYTSRDVAKLLGLTVAQVRGFARDGFLTPGRGRSEEHTSELQSQSNLVCRLLLEKKKKQQADTPTWKCRKPTRTDPIEPRTLQRVAHTRYRISPRASPETAMTTIPVMTSVHCERR